MQVDLPALDRPTKAISGTSSLGRKCNWGAVVKNFAVCNQPSATVASVLSPWLCAAPGRDAGGGFVFVVINLRVGPGPAL